jgi:hypothetical protein
MEKLGENTLENDISSSPDDTQPVKRRLGKPRQESAIWRWKDDGTYDNRPNDPEYFKKYMSVRVSCPLCNLSVLRGVLPRHKKRAICAKRQMNNS